MPQAAYLMIAHQLWSVCRSAVRFDFICSLLTSFPTFTLHSHALLNLVRRCCHSLIHSLVMLRLDFSCSLR